MSPNIKFQILHEEALSQVKHILHKVEVENWAWLMKVYESKLQYGTFSTCVTTDF